MVNTKLLFAVVVVIIVAVAGVAVVASGNDNGDGSEIEPRTVEITDSTGKRITLTAPITRICTVNTNAA